MIISLIRHGRPAVDYWTRISAAEFDAWLAAYGEADVDGSLPPPPELRDALSDCGLVITSRSRRALRSAEMLGLSARRVVMDDVGETPLPRKFPWPVAMAPLSFMVLARILWHFGAANGLETRREAVDRARRLALRLETLAGESGHVAVVGHGYLHRFTAAALRNSGWSRTRTGRGYWSLSQFQKPDAGAAGSG